MRSSWFLLFPAALLLSGCGPRIPLLGVDDLGNEVEEQVSQGEYSETLGNLLSQVHDSTLPALETPNGSPEWQLRTLVLGLSVGGDIGIGSYRLGGSTRFRIAFSNSADPALP